MPTSFLKKQSLKPKITYPLIHHLFNGQSKRHFSPGKKIYTPDTHSDRVYYVREGTVQIYNLIEDKKLIKHLAFPNEMFGIEGLFKMPIHKNFAEPLKMDCLILSIGTTDFLTNMEKNRALSAEFFLQLGKRQSRLEKRLSSKALETSEYVVIEFLEELGERAGSLLGVEILVPFMPAHEDIANILGVSRQLVSATLSKLRNLNLIYYNRNKMIIRDFYGKILKYLDNKTLGKNREN